MNSNLNPQAKLLVFAAPSGAGKTTIVRHLLQKFPQQLAFSVSATTRHKRENEQDGKDYFFISEKEFKEKIAQQAFLEYEEVYAGKFYGTLHSEIERLTQLHKSVLFDIDVEGAMSIKKQYQENALLVFVKPPSIEALINRLKARETETQAEIEKRVAKMELELTYQQYFDVTVINDNLDLALKEAEEIVSKFLKL
jgi:guanylate kinase